MDTALWAEKYRPRDFSDVVGQEEIVKRVKAFVKHQNLPHLIFTGPPGVGKTSLALVIAKQLYRDNWRQNIIELNASVTPDTPILVKKQGRIERTTFGDLGEEYFRDSTSKHTQLDGIEILSSTKDYKVKFKKATLLSRHTVGKIVTIKFEGGHVSTSFNHSLIVLDKEGNLVPKRASEIKQGDLLVTFKTVLPANKAEILRLSDFQPQLYTGFGHGEVRNPKVITVLPDVRLTPELSWTFGTFQAEGCTNFDKEGTSGQIAFTVGFPKELDVAHRIRSSFEKTFGIKAHLTPGYSGFDRRRNSSINVRFFNTQLTKFVAHHFYNKGKRNALSKKFPDWVYNAPLSHRLMFLKGYAGDATGKWGSFLRYSSRSANNLIDLVWLGRISGLEATAFQNEARLVWKMPQFSYVRSELIPSSIVSHFFKKLGKRAGFNWRNLLRHSLYSKKSARVSKATVLQTLLLAEEKAHLTKAELVHLRKIKLLANSCLSVVKVTSAKHVTYNDYVYDVTVPGAETFWGGIMPVLLHNSDERGIDVIRTKVKDFARTKALGEVPFKICILDESDSLTREAQHALRRTMENYTSTCRFVLLANYSSKLIEPIQSRCAVFRFKPLAEPEILKIIGRIAAAEKLTVDEKAKKALIEVSEGDCRKLENILQSCAVMSENITEDLIYTVASAARPKEVKDVIASAFAGNFQKARDKLLETMLAHGLSGLDVIKQLQKELLEADIEPKKKLVLIEKCGEVEFRMSEGADEFVQLEALLSQIALAGQK